MDIPRSRLDQLSETASAAFVILPRMAPESVPPLIDALASRDDQVWRLAAIALGTIGPAAKQAIPVLEIRFHDTNLLNRAVAADNVAKLGGETEHFLTVLIQCFRDGDFNTRDFTGQVFGRIKEQAKDTSPIVTSVLASTTNLDERYVYENVLKQIAPVGDAKPAGKSAEPQ